MLLSSGKCTLCLLQLIPAPMLHQVPQFAVTPQVDQNQFVRPLLGNCPQPRPGQKILVNPHFKGPRPQEPLRAKPMEEVCRAELVCATPLSLSSVGCILCVQNTCTNKLLGIHPMRNCAQFCLVQLFGFPTSSARPEQPQQQQLLQTFPPES